VAGGEVGGGGGILLRNACVCEWVVNMRAHLHAQTPHLVLHDCLAVLFLFSKLNV